MHIATSASQYILDDAIKVYGAVVSQCGKLFHSGNYICFSNGGSVSERWGGAVMNNDNVNLGKQIYSVILYTTPGGVSFTSAVCKGQSYFWLMRIWITASELHKYPWPTAMCALYGTFTSCTFEINYHPNNDYQFSIWVYRQLCYYIVWDYRQCWKPHAQKKHALLYHIKYFLYEWFVVPCCIFTRNNVKLPVATNRVDVDVIMPLNNKYSTCRTLRNRSVGLQCWIRMHNTSVPVQSSVWIRQVSTPQNTNIKLHQGGGTSSPIH